jgi:predicted permease
VKPIMSALILAVALLLAIMTANLALLMLTRYVERAPELSMRSALGATRGRLLRQLAVEALAPALLGAVLAVLVAQFALDGLIASIPEGVRIGMPYLAAATIGPEIIALIVVSAAALAVVFGVSPALLMPISRSRPGDTRTTASRRDRRLRKGLVVAQLAVTTALLVASGLLVTSFRNLVHRDLGYREPGTLVSARAPLSGERYQDPAAQRSFYETLVARSATLPGVTRVGLVDEVPGGGGGATTYETVGRPLPEAERHRVALRITGGGYFAAMGIPVLAGRTFEPQDRADAPPVAVVSAALGRQLSQSGRTVGRRLRVAGNDTLEWEVIGVAADVPVSAFDAAPPPVVYLSHLQRAENRLTLVMRTERRAAALAPELRAIVAELDPGVPVYDVATLEQRMQDSRAVLTRRLPMILCGVFAAAALLLTLVALYAVSMHEVLARRREFGIRLAVGASASSIRRLILHDATWLGGVGVASGMVAALVASRPLGALMFDVATTDWRVYLLVVLTVLGAALLAALGPLIRAGALDPAEVMRAE